MSNWERERQKSTKTFEKIWFQYKVFALWPPFKETKYKLIMLKEVTVIYLLSHITELQWYDF